MPILTLDIIRGRCEEIGDCWIWKQGTNSDGQPHARHDGAKVQVRRLVWQLAHADAVLAPNFMVISECTHKMCVGPDCAKDMSRPQYLVRMNSLGKLNGSTQAVAHTRAMRARATTKLTMEKAAALRARIAAGEDRGAVALEYGITRDHANRVARGDGWADSVQGSSVFTLMSSF